VCGGEYACGGTVGGDHLEDDLEQGVVGVDREWNLFDHADEEDGEEHTHKVFHEHVLHLRSYRVLLVRRAAR
jgi:hypothetical protein